MKNNLRNNELMSLCASVQECVCNMVLCQNSVMWGAINSMHQYIVSFNETCLKKYRQKGQITQYVTRQKGQISQ